MAETKKTTVEEGRYEEPREALDPKHKDAGQEQAEHANELQEERDKLAEKQAKETERSAS